MIREFDPESSSHQTASSTSQSEQNALSAYLCEILISPRKSHLLGGAAAVHNEPAPGPSDAPPRNASNPRPIAVVSDAARYTGARFVKTALDVEEGRNRKCEEPAPGEFSEDEDEAGGKSGHAGILPIMASNEHRPFRV
jgi:hypothetical protein